MNIRYATMLVTVCAAALFMGVSSASAADNDRYVAITAGSTSVDSNMSPLEPEGTAVQVIAGDDLFVYDGFTVSAEIGASYGNAEASRTILSCDVPNCGYEETTMQTDSSRWSASAGLRVSHSFGSIVASVGGGLIAADYRERDTYDSNGVFPTFTWQQEGYGVGTYWDVAVAYPVTDQWALVAAHRTSSLTVREWSGSFGGSSDKFDTSIWSVGGVYTFGGK